MLDRAKQLIFGIFRPQGEAEFVAVSDLLVRNVTDDRSDLLDRAAQKQAVTGVPSGFHDLEQP